VYLLAEASDTSARKVIKMHSKKFAVSTKRCISFYYSMYGEDVGSLELHLVVDVFFFKVPTTIWKKKGNQGNGWNFGYFTYRKSVSILLKLTDEFHVRHAFYFYHCDSLNKFSSMLTGRG